MKKESNFFSFKILSLFLLFLCIFSINSATVYEINQSVDGTSDYKKVEFSGDQKTLNHYFKYTFTTIPSSKISAIRFQFDEFNDASIERNRVFCTFVDASTSDSDLINTVGLMDDTTSSCIGTFTNGFYDGIIEHDDSKKKLAIYLVTLGHINFTARLYLRINEYILPVVEDTVFLDESYSLVPVTIIISHFREKASKVLFYSYTRELQMYYTEEKTPYPERLFFGNIMSVYTNPNMVRQKYKNADTMVLITKPFGAEDMIGEQFQFQIKFFASDYLLDYYMGSNLEGRAKNSPLSINMTECSNPYYVVFNYNVPEKQTSLYIDEIYGKIKSISVAPKLNYPTWEKMLENDFQLVDIDTRKFVLPENSASHIDVYKVECEVPLLLNFYYIDESASIPELDYGHVAITTLKSYKSVSLPFAPGVVAPELTIEVFNPVKDPFVIVDDGQNEKIISKNSVIRSMPFTTTNPIVLKERNGDSNSRIIIKVGYSTGTWTQVSENVVYNFNLDMYVFSFPAGADKYNYTYALLKTSGTNSDDNVKYCYGTNIGSAIVPSSENCYRVSHDNSYTIKVLNPLVMYKDYDMEDELIYYVSLRPTQRGDSLEIQADLVKYDTTERNFEGIGNNIVLNGGKENTVLTSPVDKDEYISVQIQSCDNSKLTFGVYDGYDNKQIVSDIEIPAGKKHYNTKFKNTFLETEIKLSGNSGTKVYVKHIGISSSSYTPSIKDSYPLTFDQNLNQLVVENPLTTSERMNYTVFVGKQGELSSQGLTLCSFAEIKSTIATYNKTFVSFSDKTTFNINFNKLGLSKGDKFEAIAFIEQEPNSAMSFLTDVLTGTVGEVETKSITEIKTEDSTDPDYVYVTKAASADEMTYYFSFLPTKVFNVSVGAFRIEVESDETGPFNRIACAFVNEEDDANTMVETVEDIASQYNSYCVGGRSRTNGKLYNFLFRYSYTKDATPKPRRLVIKLNNNGYNGNFNIYVRKGDNVYIEHTDFYEQKEYGKQEEFKKSIIPYIIDLDAIRGTSQTDYVSKMLIYSQHLEMQMYYLDSTEERNDPMLLFTGNIMLVYTKLTLAEQKYHATKLILLSENLNGQEHSAVGIGFRFHTKMFKSDAQIEYFVSGNPTGRTLNFPLSIEMNTCTSTNNKYYYILNYNQAEEERILYLDSVFGIMKNARIANEINAENWDNLLTSSMTEITDYTFTLSEKSQHIDVIEIECTTPLLANIYYNYEGQVFSGLGRGDIVVKNIGPEETFSFTLVSGSMNFYYSISAFNSRESPDLTVSFDSVQYHHITENSLQVGMMLNKMPYRVSVDNNKNTNTRFIFKIGYGVESEWIDEGEDIEGKLYSSGSQFVYKFPMGDNKRNFTDVVLDVKPMKKDSQEMAENVKFCYSTSIGMPIDPSQENCYRTGANIPYSLTFINPLIAPKNYKSLSDFYYVTITPFTGNEYISLGITENKYDVEDRNLEGVNKVLKLESTTNKSTILSIPEVITNTQIVVQLQACVASNYQINYVNKNAYTRDVISTGTIPVTRNDYYYVINNILMETEVEFTGAENDEIFVKHSGITDYSIITQSYYSTFDINENTVSIIKPIRDEKFKVTVLVGRPDRFNNYNLCTFAEKKESEYSTLADYAKTFTAESSNTITHFIDFRSFSYKQGDDFDLLVYAVQEENSKLEFLFPVISGKVGEIKGITEISGLIDANYVTQDFTQNRTTNYLFYDFSRTPVGDVASLKIINSEEGMRVNKVGCVFVKKGTEDVDMVSAVNTAMMEGNSVCYGQTEKDTNGFDALINAKDVKNGYGRLVIQILYGFGENDKKVKKVKNGKLSDDGYIMTINIRTNGFEVDTQNSQYNEKEDLTVMPYVFDLQKIRESQEGENYISKVMVYSSTREMQMFYIGDNGAPTELFSGNIMLVYTNPDVIKEKYHGANIMILLTDSLSNSGKQTIGEQFRFKTYFFKSDNTMQYYVSPNPDGRLLNKPTMIEMNSCDVPYYYILNYNFPEEDNRVLHIDNIFGEIDTMKIANQLNKNDWYDLIREMEEFSGNEYLIEGQTNYHMDVIEVTCKVPSLLNIYYTDESNPNYSNLGLSDIAILNLSPNKDQKLTFKSNLEGDFIYTFNVLLETGNPDVLITFEDEEGGMRITENGVFTKNSNVNYEYITVSNKKLSGNTKTKIIFKFGYSIDNLFTKINNNIYQLQKPNKTANLFAYKFNTGEDRLNTTSIDFRVSTSLENVKFCYTTNLGSYVDPSSQNCYRVGRSNSYTITVLNPYIMYKNYKAGDDKNVMDYYVSFRTEDVTHNITIYPSLHNYTTSNRNLEGYANTITITKNGSSILTSPQDNMLFVQIQSCTKDAYLSYEFKNAYNSTSLNVRDQIAANTKHYFINVPNIKLDTELALETKTSAEVFIKHIGVNQKYQPVIKDIAIGYDGSKKLNFTQPIDNEEFKYTVYLDKQGNLEKQDYTLCSFTQNSKFAYYSTSVTSKDKVVEVNLDFDSKALKGYEKFDVLVFAEQTNKGKLMILSDLFQSKKKKSSSSNLVLVIVVVILTVLLVAGGITAFILLRRYKLKPDREKLDAKETSLAMVDNKNEKMITSTATQNNE